MTTAIAPAPVIDSAIVERVLIHGDLRQLSPAQKVSYYNRVCESVGLSPLTQPFAYIVLNGKEVLYAKREATEQLRFVHGVSITIPSRELIGDVYVVTARASLASGRQDESTGAVAITNKKGDDLANAYLKAETKAKRRVTLSICGLGMLDETEVESIPGAQTLTIEAPVAAPPSPASLECAARPSDSIPAHAVTIRRIDRSATKNPNVTKTLITFSSGEQAGTINEALANLAEQLCQDGDAVVYTTKATKWGDNLLTLQRDAPAPEREIHEPPVTDKDILF